MGLWGWFAFAAVVALLPGAMQWLWYALRDANRGVYRDNRRGRWVR